MSTIRIPRRKQDLKEKMTGPSDQDEAGVQPEEIRAERAEEADFKDAKESEELPEHYRTRIDKY